MRSGLVERIVQGDRATWLVIAVLWLVTGLLVLAQRSQLRSGPTRVVALASLATASSLVSLALSMALAVPRITWRDAEEPQLVVPAGDTWRKVRGPAVQLLVAGVPELAVPSVDAEGRWVLVGLLSGKAIPGVEPAPAAPPEVGGPRLCDNESDRCRAWPASWPDPAKPPRLSELSWAKEGAATAVAHDVESGLYLREADGVGPDAKALELVGRVTNDAPREGTSALFVVRRVAGGRLTAMRVLSTPGPSQPTYRLQRAEVSLTAAPTALRWFARPLLTLTGLALPLALLVYLLAPRWLGARLRRRAAVRRELERALVLVPVTGAAVGEAMGLAMVSDDADLGDALLPRGTVVPLGPGAVAAVGRPVRSRAWFELPARAEESTPPSEALEGALAGAAVRHSERGASRKVGVLVPADDVPFRHAARAWIGPYAHAVAILLTGLAIAAPAVVAVAALVATR